MPLLKDGALLRIYAQSYKKDALNEKIAPISNFREDSFRFPALTYLYQFRVIVCTIFTAGCLARARDEPGFDSKHFEYTFIDEAGCISESTSLVPITGISTEKGKLFTKIILAGDPKQLDAVAKSKYAVQLGYKTSLLENLFHMKCFKRNSSGSYHPNRVVQLKQNYRSHSAIIHTSNHLFYNGVLSSAAPSGIFELYMFIAFKECMNYEDFCIFSYHQ